MSTDTKILIANIGPIKRLDFSVAPGVTVLRGANEVGKSTAIDAVTALTGGKPNLQARDGESSGIVAGPGLSIAISRNARNAKSGELEVAAVTDRIDLSALVDPPIKAGDARMRARIKALLSLTQATITEDVWRAQDSAGVVHSDDIDEADPITTHAKVKRRFEAAARSYSEAAANCKIKIEGLKGSLKTIGEIPEDCPTVDDANAAIREKIREADRLETERRAAIEVIGANEVAKANYKEAAESINETRGMLAKTKSDLLESRNDSEKLKGMRSRLAKEIEDLQAKLEEVDRQVKDSQIETRNLEEREEGLERQLGIIEDLQSAILDNLPTPPSEDEIAKAKLEIKAAEDIAAAARSVEQHDELITSINDATKSRDEAEKRAVAMRQTAKALDAVLANAIDSPYFTLVDGDLCYTGYGEEGREPEPFDRLSDGKRWTVAIAAVAHALDCSGGLSLVGIDQGAWEALDTKNRETVVRAAVEANLAIVTAEHDDTSEIHVETMGA